VCVPFGFAADVVVTPVLMSVELAKSPAGVSAAGTAGPATPVTDVVVVTVRDPSGFPTEVVVTPVSRFVALAKPPATASDAAGIERPITATIAATRVAVLKVHIRPLPGLIPLTMT
jgi:hypothetical protein